MPLAQLGFTHPKYISVNALGPCAGHRQPARHTFFDHYTAIAKWHRSLMVYMDDLGLVLWIDWRGPKPEVRKRPPPWNEITSKQTMWSEYLWVARIINHGDHTEIIRRRKDVR